ADAERLWPEDNRVRQHRQTTFRSRAREDQIRRADGRSQLVPARNDPDVSPIDRALVEFRAGSSRSLSLRRGISRRKIAFVRLPTRGRNRDRQRGGNFAAAKSEKNRLQRLQQPRRFSFERRHDCFREQTAFAIESNEATRRAQYRESNGHTRRRSRARIAVRKNGPISFRL